MNADEFCRTIESYLTRKNDGHLVRIVGPSFERVRGWSETGIPLKVVFAGIDPAENRRRHTNARRCAHSAESDANSRPRRSS